MMTVKERSWKKGEPVEVRRHVNGGGHKWTLGRVDGATGSRGLFVKTNDNGKSTFYHWNELREPLALEPAKTLTSKLGEKLMLVKPAIVAPKAIEPAPAAQQPAPAAKPADEKLPMAKARYAKQRLQHTPTEIGNFFRNVRLSRREGQRDVAAKLGNVTYSVLSKIELGDLDPSDDVLLRFAELYSLSLDELIALRDGASQASLSVPSLPQLPASPREQEGFISFMGQVAALVPAPADAARRAEWYGHISALYEMRDQ